MAAWRLSAALGGGPCLLSSVGDRNISVIDSRHTFLYWIKTKKAPVLYYSKKYKQQRSMVRGARGVGREMRAATLQLRAVVLRHAPAWAVGNRNGHNKKIGSTTPTRAAAAVVWPRGCLFCPSGTSIAGIAKYRVIPRVVLLGNTRP